MSKNKKNKSGLVPPSHDEKIKFWREVITHIHDSNNQEILQKLLCGSLDQSNYAACITAYLLFTADLKDKLLDAKITYLETKEYKL